MSTCNQCGHVLCDNCYKKVWSKVCDNPKCPNYGLNQVSVEQMKKLEEKK